MKNIIALIIAIILIAVVFSGCSRLNKKQIIETAQITIVEDSRGKEIKINYPANRIVCLLNSALNDLYMLGAKQQVIAIDRWTYDVDYIYEMTSQIDQRVETRSLPAVDEDIPKILELSPDVVIVGSGEREIIRNLENKGVKVFAVQVNDFDDVLWKIETLGRISGKEERAQEIISYTKDKMGVFEERIQEVPQSNTRKSIFVWGPTILDLAGKRSIGNDILEMARVRNLASQIEEEHFIANLEQVQEWNPEAVIMWNTPEISPSDYYQDVRWSEIEAVKSRNIFELSDSFYCDLWTVKYIYAVNQVAKFLHPETFEDVDLDQEKLEMLEFLYNE